MSLTNNAIDLIGAKGGGGGGSSGGFTNKPDTLRSNDSFELLLGLGSGRWKGLVNGLRSLTINGVPLENVDGSSNFKEITALFADGDPTQTQIVNFKLGGGGGITNVNTQLTNTTASPGPWVSGATTTPGADYIDFRFVIQQLAKQTKDGIFEDKITLEVEMRPQGAANWINPMKPLTTVTGPEGPANPVPTTYDPNIGSYTYVDTDTSAVMSVYVPRGRATFNTAYTARRGGGSGISGEFINIGEYIWTGLGTSPGGTSGFGYITINGKTTSPYVKELRIMVPNTGPYANKTWEARVRLIEKHDETQNPGTSNQIDIDRVIVWESLTAVTKQQLGSDPAWRGLAWLQLGGKASEQLNGFPEIRGIYDTKIVKVPPTAVYDPTTRQYTATLWDGTYAMSYTNDPAWCLKDLIEDSVSGIASISPGATLDKWDALEASKYYSQLVSDGRGGTHPRFCLNVRLEQSMDTEEMIKYLAGAVNSLCVDTGGGKWRLKVDKPETPIATFTIDNIIGDFAYTHTDMDTRYNDITLTFLNEENDYREDRLRVFDQTNINTFGRKATTIVAVGATHRQEVLRRGVLRLRTSLNETKIVKFTTNRMGRFLEPLQTILVADQALGYMPPTGSGALADTDPYDNRTTSRVISMNGARDQLTLGRSVRLEPNVTYAVKFTVPNPNYVPDTTTQPTNADWKLPTIVIERTLTNSAVQRGDTNILYLNSPLPVDIPEFSVVALSAVGLPTLPVQYRILEVSPGEGEEVNVVAVIVDTGKFAAADTATGSDVQAWLQTGTTGAVPTPGVPSWGMTTLTSFTNNGFDQRLLTANWTRPSSLFLEGYKVEHRINKGPWITDRDVSMIESIEYMDPAPGTWDIKVTAKDRRGVWSAPLIGLHLVPPYGATNVPPQTGGPLANRPTTNQVAGQLYFATDQTPVTVWRWTGSAWQLVAASGVDINGLNVYDSAGGTPTVPLIRSDVLTTLGTAAAITNQGILATAVTIGGVPIANIPNLAIDNIIINGSMASPTTTLHITTSNGSFNNGVAGDPPRYFRAGTTFTQMNLNHGVDMTGTGTQRFPVLPGETLFVSANVRGSTSGANDGWVMNLHYYNAAGVFIQTNGTVTAGDGYNTSLHYLEHASSDGTANPNVWVFRWFATTVPANAAYCVPVVQTTAAAVGATFDIANIRIARTQPGATSGAPTGTLVGGVPADQLGLVADNLIVNGAFAPPQDTIRGVVTPASFQTGGAGDPPYFIRTTGAATILMNSGMGPGNRRIPVNGGERLYISGYVRGSGSLGANDSWNVGPNFYTAAGALIGQGTLVSGGYIGNQWLHIGTGSPNTWILRRMIITAPSNAAYMVSNVAPVVTAGATVDFGMFRVSRTELGASYGADLNGFNLFDSGSATPTTPVTRTTIVTSLGTASSITGQGPFATDPRSPIQVFSPGSNVLVNGSFRLGLNFWTNITNFNAGNDSFSGRFASTSVAGVQAMSSNPILASAGQTATLSGEMFSDTAALAVHMDLQFYQDTAGTIPTASGSDGANIDKPTGVTSWSARQSLTYTCPAGTQSFRVRAVKSNGSAGQFAAWRRIKVESGSLATPFSDEATTSAVYMDGTLIDSLRPGEAGANVTETRVSSGITAQGPWATYATSIMSIAHPGVNQFPYPRGVFDGRTPAELGWLGTDQTAGGIGHMTIGSADWLGGRYYGFSGTTTGALTIYPYYDVPVSSDVVGGYIGASLNGYSSGTGASFSPYFEFLNSGGTAISSVTLSLNSATGRWEGSGLAPANVAKVRLVVRGIWTGAGAAAHIFWNIKVEAGPQRVSPYSEPPDLITVPGGYRRLGDGRNQPTNRNFGLEAVRSSPGFSDTWVAGTPNTVTINISASSYLSDWGTTINLPSGTIPGCTPDTKYYIWRVQPDPTTAGTSYGASTVLADAMAPGKSYLGFWTTRATSGSGGGGGGWGNQDCVDINAHVLTLEGDIPAGLIRKGQKLVVLEEENMNGVAFEKVERNWTGENERVRLTTESGITLTLAINTPIVLRDRKVVKAFAALNCEVPVLDEGDFRWEKIVDIQGLDYGPVAHIICGQKTFAAGDQPNRYILTHNQTVYK